MSRLAGKIFASRSYASCSTSLGPYVLNSSPCPPTKSTSLRTVCAFAQSQGIGKTINEDDLLVRMIELLNY